MKGIIFISIAVVVVIPLVIALVVWQRRLAAARIEALKSIATRLRAEFRPGGSPDLVQSLATLPLCSKRSRGKLSNLLQRFSDDPELAVFDFEYYQSSGQSGHMVRQTVACLDLDPMSMPEFSLHPESVIDRIAVKFGGQDIDFDQYPAFSSKYRLKSPRESEIRRSFTSSVITWLEQQPTCHLECTGRRIIWYESGKLIGPEQMEQFVRAARECFKHVLPA
jgi:hypothetical protein